MQVNRCIEEEGGFPIESNGDSSNDEFIAQAVPSDCLLVGGSVLPNYSHYGATAVISPKRSKTSDHFAFMTSNLSSMHDSEGVWNQGENYQTSSSLSRNRSSLYSVNAPATLGRKRSSKMINDSLYNFNNSDKTLEDDFKTRDSKRHSLHFENNRSPILDTRRSSVVDDGCLDKDSLDQIKSLSLKKDSNKATTRLKLQDNTVDRESTV